MARLSRDNINLILEYACDGPWISYLDDEYTIKHRVNRNYAPIGRILSARIVMPCIFFTLQQRLCVMHKVGIDDGFWAFSTTESLNDDMLTITIYAYQYTDRNYANLLVDLYCMAAPDFIINSTTIEPIHIGMAKRLDALDSAVEVYSWQIELDI
jgi:hypothetical protein